MMFAPTDGYDFTGANCRNPGASAENWFPKSTAGAGLAAMKARVSAAVLCRGCPHTRQCARLALSIPMVSGIWAGQHIPSGATQARRDAMHRVKDIAGARA